MRLGVLGESLRSFTYPRPPGLGKLPRFWVLGFLDVQQELLAGFS